MGSATNGPSPGNLAGIGVGLAVLVVVPLLVGIFVDRALGTAPLFLLLGLGLGIAASVLFVYVRYVRRFL
ncbi:MAG: AtpZ/AtpI family protein [Candidatus Dormibacteraceae bacterium]